MRMLRMLMRRATRMRRRSFNDGNFLGGLLIGVLIHVDVISLVA